jgi:hypothetical protein
MGDWATTLRLLKTTKPAVTLILGKDVSWAMFLDGDMTEGVLRLFSYLRPFTKISRPTERDRSEPTGFRSLLISSLILL